MKNIIQLQDDLRSVPLKNLIFYVQNPSGEVPSYLALSEIKRRKDMEQRANAQQPSSLSVAEELTAPRQNIGPEFDTPQTMLAAQKNAQASMMPTETMNQGVAGLPIPDQMFSGQSMAAGGIVAFDDGGDVNYADGGMVAFGPGGDVATKRYQAMLEDNYFSPGSLYAGAKDLLGMPFQYRVAYDPITDKYMSRRALEGNTPNLDKYRKAAELRKQGLLAEADTLEKAASSPKVNKGGLASLNTSSANVEPGMTFSPDEIANIYQSTLPPTKTKAPMAEAVPQDDVTKPAPGPAPQQAGIDSLLEKTEGVAKDRMSRYREMIGEDPERARLEELSKKYDTSAKEQERIAPYMSLAKAGFAIAGGKSPFALQNIGEGAQVGLTDYAQARDKLDKLTEKQIDIRTKMGQAKRAEDIAAATEGLKSEAAIEARNAQVKLKDMEEKNEFKRTKYAADVSTKNAMIAAAKKSDYESFIELAKQDDDNYKTVKDKDGTVRKVFNANKVTQAFKSFGGSSGLDDDKLAVIWDNNKFNTEFIKKYPSPADYILSERAKLSGANAPVASPASSGFFNFRQTSK